ncbi:uncharacterized protein LOC9650319 isoform X2 [Selaginella moellendorffii]|uniref:uncharacterized protein LOC9650319 isoform X2 n=1 Tax=Selaginella moellendorffii TaxID=88036 RepID=UPI000D1D0636|nr:uncharacterized protein LOC9650319 isoform X2 [Selaginella moellendorffii]|eukprot:XP_024529117.1 uncharacterized protein LOC9650319 isoform X2 [Selaginella moellendorffii]
MRRASAQALYSNRTARALHNLPSRRRSSRLNRQAFVIALVALFVLCSIGLVICWSFVFPDDATRISGSKSGPRVSRIAFGSSSSHDYSAQPVWVHGIIPSDPHAWIWLGNMAYLDEARVNCDASPNHYQCNCSADWLRQPPHFCMTGDLEHAASKMQVQLANPDYAQFLAFMCPGHREKGLFPPPGADPAVCPKRIFGTYSDHDYGWRHGNKRLPQKDALKQVFLDALGESLDSPRRNGGRGIEWKYTLNQESKGYEIDVILLDTRYYRDPLPCHTKRAFCKDITRTKTSPEHRAWCEDFLGGETGMGSCCGKDKSELPKLLSNSNFCDVLGNHQRNWLETTLLQSNSPVKLIVSSSSVLAADDEASSSCSLDNWDCYTAAQMNLLELLTKASGCVIILSSGLEHSRIRVLRPGLQARYGGLTFPRALYEVALSGLTNTSDKSLSCDEVDCGPSFGMIEIENGMVKLQSRDGMSGQVKLESAFPLATCYA